MSASLHQNTPSLAAFDPRGLLISAIRYQRVVVGAEISTRTSRQVFNANGHLHQQWDPRLLALSRVEPDVKANVETRRSLSGTVLQTVSVDAGLHVAFFDSAGLLSDEWDGRGIHRSTRYDELTRPAVIVESPQDASPRCVERFTYAGSSGQEVSGNRRGQLIRHDDTAGSLCYAAYGLSGQALVEARQFCASLTTPNWPESELDLEVQAYTTHWRHDALGGVVVQTDAAGHVQRFKVDVAGQRFSSYLDNRPLLKSATYDAFGKVEVERAGNDVVTTACYDPVDGKLSSLKVETSRGKILQKMKYLYDPVGNFERIEDAAQPAQWFHQQRIQAVNTYTYDTLDQLAVTTGRENVSQTMGPDLPELALLGTQDDTRWRNYTQTYSYDWAANLTQLKHNAGPGNVYTREMRVDALSNRSVLEDGSPIDFTKAFDSNGNQQCLTAGQIMEWNARNQLQLVTQVVRVESEGSNHDAEVYVYDGSGMRVRKVRRVKSRTGEHLSEVRYLPGLEIRTHTSGEKWQRMTAQAGRNVVHCLHWVDGLPEGVNNDQLRYCLSDHMGSATLELDEYAGLLSQESYYPYGGTAWWAAKNAVEAKYKIERYSGKERDATGLYCYGYRYFAPWLQRWINPDPAGEVDGLNLYAMVHNNPVTLRDLNGLASDDNLLIIHMFYYGAIPQDVALNMVNTIKVSPNNKIKLWFDEKAKRSFTDLSGDFSNYEIKEANELRHIKSRNDEASFENIDAIFASIEEADNDGREKSLSDLVELLSTYEYGGLYLDADVVVHKEFSKAELFGDSEFKTHVSINENIANIDYYDALGFRDAFDGHLEEVLAELSSDFAQGNLVGASEPGQMVRINNIVRLKLKDVLGEDEIDDAVSEGEIPDESLGNVVQALNRIDISASLKGKIQFMPMKKG